MYRILLTFMFSMLSISFCHAACHKVSNHEKLAQAIASGITGEIYRLGTHGYTRINQMTTEDRKNFDAKNYYVLPMSRDVLVLGTKEYSQVETLEWALVIARNAQRGTHW